MITDVPDTERMLRANRRSYSSKNRSATRMEVMRAFSDGANTLGVFAEQLLFHSYPAAEEHPIPAVSVALGGQATFRGAIGGFHGWIIDDVTASVTNEAHNGVERTYKGYRPCYKAWPTRCLMRNRISSISRTTSSKKFGKAAPSRRKVKTVEQAILHHQHFIAPVETIFKRENQESREYRIGKGRSTTKICRPRLQYR